MAMVAALLLLVAAPFPADAQPATKVARIGYLVTGSLDFPATRVVLDAFREGLRERGYVEGQNIVIEYRAADGKVERFPARVEGDVRRIRFMTGRDGGRRRATR